MADMQMQQQGIAREIESAMLAKLREDTRVLLLFGARRVGKTTLARRLLTAFGGRSLEISGDELVAATILSSRDGERLRGFAQGYDLLFIDEAQRIPEIGLGLKILHDTMPGLRILATGSSALDLASKTKEALTGRAWTFQLAPFSQRELLDVEGSYELGRKLDRDLVFGTYPESRAIPGDSDRVAFLRELHASYLFKDIFELGGIRQPRKIVDLLRLLAMQVGSEVSLNELGTLLSMSKDTVASYLDILEKSFIVFRLPAFSRNLRNEVARSTKVYFFDNGVRNAAMDDFRPFESRMDQGALWENFIVAERRKRRNWHGFFPASYFWRLSSGPEIDYVEEGSGELHAWEIKLSPTAKARVPKSWAQAYPAATWTRVDRSNYLDFVAGEI